MGVQGWLPDSRQCLGRCMQTDTKTPPCSVCPWKSAAITPPHPAAPRGHTGSVLFPFCFYVARFPPNSGQFCFLRGTCCPDKVLHLCLPVQGEVKASLPQSPSEGWEVWREHLSVVFPTKL